MFANSDDDMFEDVAETNEDIIELDFLVTNYETSVLLKIVSNFT